MLGLGLDLDEAITREREVGDGEQFGEGAHELLWRELLAIEQALGHAEPVRVGEVFEVLEALGEVLRGASSLGRDDVAGARERLLGQFDLGLTKDLDEGVDLGWRDQAERLPLVARATGSAGAVNVDIGGLGEHEVDDVAQVRDVDAARGDIGRHEVVDLGVAQELEGLLALFLREIAVELGGGVAVALEEVGHDERVALGVGEDDRVLGLFELEDLDQIAHARDARHADIRVLDVLVDDRITREAQVLGVEEHVLRERLDPFGDRRREQQALTRLGQELQDRAKLALEAHREHLVGFVEDEEAQVLEREILALEQVEQAPWRRADDLRGLERLELWLVGGAAVDGRRFDGAELGQALELVADLLGQLARRREDEDLHAARIMLELFDDWDAERGGLPGARLRLHDQIDARQDEGDRGRLHGRRVDVVDRRESLLELGAQVQLFEGLLLILFCRHDIS